MRERFLCLVNRKPFPFSNFPPQLQALEAVLQQAFGAAEAQQRLGAVGIRAVQIGSINALPPLAYDVSNASAAEPWIPWQLDRVDQRLLPVDREYTATATGRGVNGAGPGVLPATPGAAATAAPGLLQQHIGMPLLHAEPLMLPPHSRCAPPPHPPLLPAVYIASSVSALLLPLLCPLPLSPLAVQFACIF